jgi:hypothetical protein
MSRAMNHGVLAALIVCSTAVTGLAQQSTTATAETKTFEVLAVEGNRLDVRMPEGTREITVPEDFRFTVNGQSMSVHELKPGMKGEATITTRTTVVPVTVTEVKNGTVMKSTGATIILRTDQGIRSFTQDEVDKRGVKIIRQGKPAQLSEFHEGDVLSATIITSKPPSIMTEREVTAALAAVPAPVATAGVDPAPAPPRAVASAQPAPAQAPVAASAAAAPALPKTASSRPMVAFAGVLLLAAGLAMTARRLVAPSMQ